MSVHKEKDQQVIESILIYLKSSLINLEYLQDILKRKKEAKCSNSRHEASYHGGSNNAEGKYAEVKCKRCGGAGNVSNPSTGGTMKCTSCGGDGWTWTPSAAGHEKPCGNCKGNGTTIVDHQPQSCQVCNGTGWAHSKPNPPEGWWEK
jgi:DnaJ-class molecular chaperone